MARPLRISFENAVYHITAQGHRKEQIFLTEQDKIQFIRKVNEVFERHSVVCYSYCLMNNHYHLFIRTRLANISKVIHDLNSSYSSWFKAKYNIAGPVFRGRFKSILVETESYGISLSAYIHLNPVRARLVRNPVDYRWSSAKDILGTRKPMVKNLDSQFLLGFFGSSTKESIKTFIKYMDDNSNMPDIRRNVYKGIALGSEDFENRVNKILKQRKNEKEIPVTRSIGMINANRIIDVICDLYRTDIHSIVKKKKHNEEKKIAVYLIRKMTALSLKEIGEIFNLDYSSISKMVKRFEVQLPKKPLLREVIRTLEQDLGR